MIPLEVLQQYAVDVPGDLSGLDSSYSVDFWASTCSRRMSACPQCWASSRSMCR